MIDPLSDWYDRNQNCYFLSDIHMVREWADFIGKPLAQVDFGTELLSDWAHPGWVVDYSSKLIGGDIAVWPDGHVGIVMYAKGDTYGEATLLLENGIARRSMTTFGNCKGHLSPLKFWSLGPPEEVEIGDLN
jgi:hypothetical protein